MKHFIIKRLVLFSLILSVSSISLAMTKVSNACPVQKSEREILAAIRTFSDQLDEDVVSCCASSKKRRDSARRTHLALDLNVIAQYMVDRKPLAAMMHLLEIDSQFVKDNEMDFKNKLFSRLGRLLKQNDEDLSEYNDCVFCLEKTACVYSEKCCHLFYCEDCLQFYANQQQQLCPLCSEATQFKLIDRDLLRNYCFFCKKKVANILLRDKMVLTCADCLTSVEEEIWCCSSDRSFLQLYRAEK